MSDDRKYVRVYYNDLIRDYPDVWASDAALATWLRMLATADPMWPTPPELPRSVRAKPLGDLVDASLVSVDGAHRFQMKGMDAERTRRSDAGRNAAAQRWQSKGNADRNAESMPKRAEQSKDEQSKDETNAGATDDRHDAPETEALIWLSKHGCDIRPGNGYHQKLVLAVEHHGVNSVVGMLDRLRAAGTRDGDIKGFLFGAIDALDARNRPKLSELEAEDRADESSAARQRRIDRTRSETAAMRSAIEGKGAA